jgi:hypothetical protein
MVIEIIMTMLLASEPPISPQDINIVELSKVLHHVNEDVCLGVELTVKEQEWIEIPKIKDIKIHRYEVVDIKPNKVLELYCVIHDKYEHVIYKTSRNEI